MCVGGVCVGVCVHALKSGKLCLSRDVYCYRHCPIAQVIHSHIGCWRESMSLVDTAPRQMNSIITQTLAQFASSAPGVKRHNITGSQGEMGYRLLRQRKSEHLGETGSEYNDSMESSTNPQRIGRLTAEA